ncbi:MAG: sigma-70 family RNA polymerase sigma factor [bacterium]|nr:sigma-70 family RNA polymerase sigma factor [bacterium]
MSSALGERLAAEGQRLHLLMEHLAGRAVRSRVEPEDLVQEVFVRALGRPELVPGTEHGDEALRRWLNALARNVVVDVARALRAAKRDGQASPLVRSAWSIAGTHESRVVAPAPGPATRACGAEEMRRLAAAYRALSPDHRRVLGLRQFEGLSAAETGRRMGRSEPAVHSLYRRALEAWEAATR